jgi:hypothetical protein
MKKSIFRGAILVIGLAASLAIASAQDTPGLEGTWFANVTNIDCQSSTPISTFRALYMFSHDGSYTSEAAFFAPSPRRSSGLGAWQHSQAHTYSAIFWFFRYNPDGSFFSTREVTQTIQLNGDQFSSMDKVTEYDANDHVISTGCAVSIGKRAQ